MTPPFDSDEIRRHWRPLDWAAAEPLDQAARRYVRYYGLDFPNHSGGLDHGFGYFQAAGYTLAVHTWRPPRPRGTVLVCHGYFDHVGLFVHVIGRALELGYAVIAYDLPGHGLSSGPRAEIDDFSVYQTVLNHCLAEAVPHFPGPWHTIAQSTGGAIIMEYLLRHGERAIFQESILLAPLVRPYKWNTVRWLHALVKPFTRSIKRVFTVNSGDPDFLDFLENRDPLQPRRLPACWVTALKKWLPVFTALPSVALSPVVIQGDRDETVDWPYNLRVIEEKFAAPEVHILEGARHQLANEERALRRRVLNIIDRHLGA